MTAARNLFTELAAGLMLLQAVNCWAAARQEWNFSVYLDDDRIGYHRFALGQNGTNRTLLSDARFDVKLWMFTAYRYTHQAQEVWQGDCLTKLKADTDDNGARVALNGALVNGRFQLQRGRSDRALTGCVMTFAYWNPRMVEQRRLLNPQTGEYLDVQIDFRGHEPVSVRGKPVNAARYHLDAGKFQIDLWYSDDREWVALDSEVEGGRRLRYRIE